MNYKIENKNHLLLQEKFWIDILNEKKLYEYRKLSKGLIKGHYFFFSTENKKYLGSVELYPLYVNELGSQEYLSEGHEPSIDFVEENYVAKNIDYVCYEIGDIKVVQ